MPLKDNKNKYGEISLLNHWVVAIIIFIMLTLGLIYDFLPKSNAREIIINYHISIGLLIMPFIIWRIIWRIKYGFLISIKNILVSKIKNFVHILLLITVSLLIISGPIYIWTEAEPLRFFGLIEIPSPFVKESKLLHDLSESIHKFFAKPVLISLITLHFIAAIKSIFWDKRETFTEK